MSEHCPGCRNSDPTPQGVDPLGVMKDKRMKWWKELACKIFGHAPAFASLNLPNCCITCKTPMLWNPGHERWEAMPRPPEDDVYRSLD